MAIKPILFNTEMVRVILDGRKTCTRRVIKPQPQSGLCYTYAGGHKDCIGKWTYPNRGAHKLWGEEYKLPENIKDEELSKRWNPPYHTGDILYVRETWQCWRAHRYEATADIRFRAGGDDVRLQFANGNTDSINRLDYDTFVHKWFSHNGEWKPSLFMPKEAARIWLKVTEVRAGRLQDITPKGAESEGVGNLFYDDIGYGEKNYGTEVDPEYGIAKEQFAWLWESTIKKSDIDRYGWDANPYVWIIEFERCEKPKGV
nr:MAG TPA: ASCH domain protein [Caudoviricetes sp.]